MESSGINVKFTFTYHNPAHDDIQASDTIALNCPLPFEFNNDIGYYTFDSQMLDDIFTLIRDYTAVKMGYEKKQQED